MRDFRRRSHYWFDKTMARGTLALVGWLALICLIADIPISLVLAGYGAAPHPGLTSRLTEMWKIVGSTFKIGGQVGPPGYIMASIAGASVALLFASTLISLITAGVNKKILDLRKGRSHVLESGHVVMAGWSDEAHDVVSELRAGSERHGHSMVVILADRDKADMEDDLRTRSRIRTRGARIVCRSGNPVQPAHIDQINPQAAQSIIVLAMPGPDTDEQVVKTMLAIRARTASRIVAAVTDPANLAAAAKAGGENATLLDADDLTGRWIAQAALQPGLSLVLAELLRFAGNEFCMLPVPELTGRTFAEATHTLPTATLVGVSRADGTVRLNPPAAAVFAADDEVIAISAQDTLLYSASVRTDEDAIVKAWPARRAPIRLLILGWNRRSALIIRQLDSYVPAGSRFDIVAMDGHTAFEKIRTDLSNAEIGLRHGDPTDPMMLSSLDLGGYQHIIVLSSDNVNDGHADFRCLVTLLHLRDLEAALGRRIGITGEIADDHTRELAPVSEGDDFIISRMMLTRLMTQLAANPRLAPVFAELFDAEGNEIFIRPAADYVLPGRETTFATVAESALRKGQVAIGYRIGAEHMSPPRYGIHVNPDKRLTVTLGPADQVIVIGGA